MKTMTMTTRPSVDLPGTLKTFSLSRVWTAIQVAGERRRLAKLDKAAMADMGLSPEQVAIEAHRPFWDLPAGR